MLQSSKERASREVSDFIELFRAHRIRCTNVLRIASAAVEFLGSRLLAVTLLIEQARILPLSSAVKSTRAALSVVMRGHSRSKNGVLSHAYDPRIHDDLQQTNQYCHGLAALPHGWHQNSGLPEF